MSHYRMVLLVLVVGLLTPWSELMGVFGGTFVVPEKCTLPARQGKCKAAFPRYYHDMTDMTCKKFIWGGCGPILNNFESPEECLQECQNVDPEDLW
ncbi:UNVERIFIED_CONTAM: hypothetical protein K2H54_024207 [Gekko kuhli]